MLLSGTACSMFGLAHYYNIHSMWYFIGVQVFIEIIVVSLDINICNIIYYMSNF